ncbi:MAG: PAS domain-containing protein [Thermoplasmatota archaeon]
MGDTRFAAVYDAIRAATNRIAAIRALSDEDVVSALAWASTQGDALFANFLATEATNRIVRGRRVVEHVSDCIIALDRGGRITLANPAAQRVVGLLEDELLGKPLWDALRGALPAAEVHTLLAPLRAGRETEKMALLVSLRDGRREPYQFSIIPIRVDEEVAGAVIDFHPMGAGPLRDPKAALVTSHMASPANADVGGPMETQPQAAWP